jgi:hypothetical protein
MSKAQTFYEDRYLYEGLTWWFVSEQIGQGLRERYQVPKELPAELLALVTKLEAIESKSPRARTFNSQVHNKSPSIASNLPNYALPVEPRSVIGVIIVIALITGSALSIMNKACKSGHHAWCAPMFTYVHHRTKTQPPA